ncbi:MAG: ATP-binding protein, partial [Acetobacteraceae bacterium]
AHTVLVGAAGLRDGSFLVFSAAMAPTIIPALPSAPLVASLVFASAVVVAFFVLRTINAPLRRLAQAADQYGRGKPITLPERGPREIVQAERAFNAMQRRIQRLIADRTQALAAVSHDLRTPIARLRLRCGLLADATVRGECERDLLEMEAMIEATLAYLRGDDDTEVPRLTDIASMLTTLVDAAVDAGYQATLNGPYHAVLMVRALSVKRAVTNLINNALAYGDTAWVTLEQAADSVRIVIDDDGPGIPESDMPQIFEPFHRLEVSRNRGTGGVGLGLTIARRAIEREGGSLRLLNRAEGGLRAEIRLPVSRHDGAVGSALT